MTNITIRALKQSDIPQMTELMATREDLDREGAEKRGDLLAWLAFHNPWTRNGEPTYYVAEDEGRIIAYHGRMPTQFVVMGELRRGYYVHDLYVHPDYRKKGMGFWLTMSLAKTIEDQTDTFFCLYGMTPLNREMQRRRNYLEHSTQTYVKTLSPRRYLDQLLRLSILAQPLSSIGRLLLDFVDRSLSLFHPRNVSTVRIDRFDSRFDELDEKLTKSSRICSQKSSIYLNWKYVDRPFRRETVFAATGQDGKIIGFVVVGISPYAKKYPRGSIIDLVVDPDNPAVSATLIKKAIEFFRTETAVESITCIVTDERVDRTLKRFLFFSRNEGKHLMIGNLHKCGNEREHLSNIRNWNLTLGESDSFMLSPGQ